MQETQSQGFEMQQMPLEEMWAEIVGAVDTVLCDGPRRRKLNQAIRGIGSILEAVVNPPEPELPDRPSWYKEPEKTGL